VIVPRNAIELYTASLENRTSITIIEAVSAAGEVTPPILIIPGKVHMDSWYHESLIGIELVLLSEFGYLNDELAIKWLKHFITHTNSTSTSTQKLLVLDSHLSYLTNEFVIQANEYNILIYAFPSHLTHVLQLLDVGIFQPYKHYHRQAVHTAIRNLELEYTLRSFMRDLLQIRKHTFTKLTITHAFKKARLWLVDSSIAIQKLRKYSKPQPELQLPTALIPSSFKELEAQLQQWKAKLPLLVSSPSRPSCKNWLIGTEEVLASGQL
jgi:hypothetical protein